VVWHPYPAKDQFTLECVQNRFLFFAAFTQLHSKLFYTLFLDIQEAKFNHNHCTRAKQTNMYLVPICRTEFGKNNPINAGIKTAMKLNINVCLQSSAYIT